MTLLWCRAALRRRSLRPRRGWPRSQVRSTARSASALADSAFASTFPKVGVVGLSFGSGGPREGSAALSARSNISVGNVGVRSFAAGNAVASVGDDHRFAGLIHVDVVAVPGILRHRFEDLRID